MAANCTSIYGHTRRSLPANSDVEEQAEHALLPPHASDMLAVRLQAIDDTGLSPLSLVSENTTGAETVAPLALMLAVLQPFTT